MNDPDFEKQLEYEALEKQKQEHGEWHGDSCVYTDPKDGTVYEWNAEKQAWFPKIDDNFIAAYQASYGYENTATSCTSKEETTSSAILKQPQKGEKRKVNSEPGWFEVDDAHNTNVYVSNLPLSMTDEEFVELMSKCGLIMKDPDSGQFKIKLYRNPDGSLKGDGRCCYIKVESVDLALNILDGYIYKDKVIHVERAKFEMKGTYDPSKKPRKKKGKEKEKMKKKIEKLFDWRPEKLRGMRGKHENVVIIFNMFDPVEFERDPSLIMEYQKDVREECSKCGEVKKVIVYDRHPEGIVSVSFKEVEQADECVILMNGRWFAGRQLRAETWDGRTKYKIEESAEDREKRLAQWDKFLDGEEGETKSASANPTLSNTKTEKNTASSTIEVGNSKKKTTSKGTVSKDEAETESSGESEPDLDESAQNLNGKSSTANQKN
ncbi:17S U2 SnRNP complex component HTATSF1 [Centruroides vittatus]|uniref:17S U2 SnRNP complex component HTATSF1 n=1 Tax=Centruroides vittatus TaxID=120091 RepID=UPI00351080B7